jgi:hypothetical protein
MWAWLTHDLNKKRTRHKSCANRFAKLCIWMRQWRRALPDDQERLQNESCKESSQEAEFLSPICIGIGSAEITV